MKIALVAMSGIRACDPELLRLGLTLPGFVERARTIASLPSLGLLTLAGQTPPEHEVSYHEVDELRAAGTIPLDADLVAISTFSAQAPEAYELAARFVGRGIPVVIGGLHATALPEEVVAAGATAAVGEGERIWPAILRDAEAGTLRPIYDARAAAFDLAEAPMPRYDLLDPSRYNRLTVQASRGCPWRCTFCASSVLLRDGYAQKPIARVLAEIDRIREVWPRPFLEFADDNAFVNRGWWRALLPHLESRGLRWFAETDLSVHEDADFLRSLRRAGCRQLLLGLESPVPEGLDGIELHRNWKWETRDRGREAVRRIQAEGIRVTACFVVGLDGHTPAIFEEVLRFAEEAAPFDVQVTYPTPFPGTPLHRDWRAEGRLTRDGEWNRCTLFDINFAPRPMTEDELREGFHDLVRRLYSEDFTAWRREKARRMRRPTARAV